MERRGARVGFSRAAATVEEMLAGCGQADGEVQYALGWSSFIAALGFALVDSVRRRSRFSVGDSLRSIDLFLPEFSL